jgi:1,4-alpha-glucan branching enzyme
MRKKKHVKEQKSEEAIIEFNLFAPTIKDAVLIGSFSDWNDLAMKKGADGYFRAQVPLKDGDYQYRFKVQSKSWFYQENQWVTITDPYATDIDDASQNGVVHIKNGQRIVDEYQWQHDDKALPADTQLVIYELHVGDFSGGEADPSSRGKYADVIAKLDYLSELGINAIELMPVKEFPGDRSWGYNPKYFFAAESSYGSTAELKQLIDECHARGIRVLMDGVYNHSHSESPLTQIDHDYWYHHDPKDPQFNWGPEFNYEFFDEKMKTLPARKFIGEVVRFWIQEYHIDGIRYDAARQIGNYDFLRWIVEETKETVPFKPFYNVAEYFPLDPSITGPDGPMDGCWHDLFMPTIVQSLYTDERNLEAIKEVIDAKRKGFMKTANIVNYLSNHDHERLMAKLGEQGIFGEEAFRRAKLGATILMTAFGIPMLWMGEEFGEFKPKTIDENKLNWQFLANKLNRDLFNLYKGLIALRKQHPAFASDNISFFHEDVENKVLAYERWAESGEKLLVVVNFSGQALTAYRVANVPENGCWQEWAGDFKVEVSGNQLALDLPERAARIFIKAVSSKQ